MKPLIHARNSVKRYGGTVEDYLPIHDFMDSTKAASANFYHRAILHNSFGIFLVEKVFGTYFTNSTGKQVSVRDIAEDHVKEDCRGMIPTIDDWLKDLPPKDWMLGRGMKTYVESIGMEVD
ncbi:MAG: hypothetical protein WCY93_07825 [Anaerolineaceae bacterium]